MTRPLLVEAELALLDSVKRGDTSAVGWLLEAGTDPNAFDVLEEQSALRLATTPGHLAIARLLLEHGARPLPPEANGAASPAAPPKAEPPPAVEQRLTPLGRMYRQHGYVRRPRGWEQDESVGQDEDWQVRFLVSGKRAQETLKKLLEQAGLEIDPPPRGRQQRVTVTGREAVKRLLALVVAPDG
jgi:hypothetical protein